MKRQKRQSKRKKSKIMMIVFLCAAIYAGYILVDQQRLILDKNQKLEDLSKKIQTETGMKEELLKKKELVNSDAFIEETARDKLGMVRQDEVVFMDANR